MVWSATVRPCRSVSHSRTGWPPAPSIYTWRRSSTGTEGPRQQQPTYPACFTGPGRVQLVAPLIFEPLATENGREQQQHGGDRLVIVPKPGKGGMAELNGNSQQSTQDRGRHKEVSLLHLMDVFWSAQTYQEALGWG